MGVFTQKIRRIASILLCLAIALSTISISFPAFAVDYGVYNGSVIEEWMSRADQYGEFGSSGRVGAFGGGRGGGFASNVPKNYYTVCSESKEDRYGNVTNYYRGGDTTSTKIIDSYNHTFNTIHNTNNTTNNYSANVKLSDFLNTYTTVNNDYTYNTEFKSWYYDNTQNTLNYSDDDTFYALDDRQYYISIDNSTDEYYLVDVQYSPTFVTVNYTYNTTNNSTNNYGDVTNIYYFELTDGRNSSTLSASEVAGLDLGYDVAPYELVPDDPNTLSLQHFDGDYTDSSSYGREFHSVNRSVNYVDSGAFGKAVQLASGSEAGVVIPGLADLDKFSIEFRANHNLSGSASSVDAPFQLFVGGLNLHQRVAYKVDSTIYYSKSTSEWLSQSHVNSCSRCQSFIGYGYTRKLDGNPYSKGAPYGARAVNDLAIVQNETQFKTWEDVSNLCSYSNPYSYQYGCFLDTSVAVINIGSIKHKDWFEYSHESSKTFYLSETEKWIRSGTTATASYLQFSNFGVKNQWNTIKFVFTPGKIEQYTNGDLVYSYDIDWSGAVTGNSIYIKPSGTLYLDELRVCGGDLVTSAQYTPSTQPFDTNKVLALPDAKTANTIYVRHSVPVSAYRIGGVRPSNPTAGFFYVPLHDDYTGGQPQLYDGSNWVDVEAMVYDGSTLKSALGYVFNPVGSSPDVDVDLKPERPTKPGEDVDPDACQHEWEETGRKEASCTLAGSITYTCDKCRSTKSETLPKMGHSWEVKTSVATIYDEAGNVVTQGYTIYRCSVCGEEYKDTEGTGPPVSSTPDTPDDGEGNWFTKLLKRIGDFFGTTIGGLLELVGAALNKILDSLIKLVEDTIERLKQLVDMFGSFGEALGVLWTWLPPEIMTVLVAGVTVFVFVALLKLFLK